MVTATIITLESVFDSQIEFWKMRTANKFENWHNFSGIFYTSIAQIPMGGTANVKCNELWNAFNANQISIIAQFRIESPKI